MANSPLYGRWQQIDSIRGAVVALGLQRMRDIAVSCSILRITPSGKSPLDPLTFWEHSLGCALVCRQFARRIDFRDPAKAYLGGLLHDIGIVAELSLLPKEFQAAFEQARSQGTPLHDVEMNSFGFTHCDVGKLVAEKWHFTPDLVTVVGCHHDPHTATGNRDLTALVALGDLLCRMSGLGHGYVEEVQVDFVEEPSFTLLLEECPNLKAFDWARLTFEIEAYMEEVHRLVGVLYRAGR